MEMKIAPPPKLEDVVNVRVSRNERRRAEAAARASGVSLSELVRQATRAATRQVLGRLADEAGER